ncbi:alpha/beta hydrolase [Candidatus Parcubacteria bacterium]|nr:alpha/beta hydrolase [Candidatus Parcubacteria bacterium]
MKKLLIILLVLPFVTNADVDVASQVNSDTTWSPDNGVYILKGEVDILASSTLNIEPGTIIKSSSGGGSVLRIMGNLNINGTTENPVVFTLLEDDSFGGDTNQDGTTTIPLISGWQGIIFQQGSQGNISNAKIYYTGYGGFGFGFSSALYNDGGLININNADLSHGGSLGIFQVNGTTTLTHSTIDSFGTAVSVTGGSADIRNNVISNNTYGVSKFGGGMLTLIENNFSNNSYTSYLELEGGFRHSGNTSTDKVKRGFQISGSSQGDVTLDYDNLPYIVENAVVRVPVNSSLTVPPGTVFKLGDQALISIDGKLNVNGDENNKVYFTSLKDDSIGGDTNADADSSKPNAMNWPTIFFDPGSEVNIRNAVFQYAGQSTGITGALPTLYNAGSTTLQNVDINHNPSGEGIYQTGGNLNANNLSFSDVYIGLKVLGGEVNIHNSKISNLVVGIDNQGGVVRASHNWWGSKDGPRTQNSTSTGQLINGDINFDNWIKRDPDLPNPVIIIPGIMGSEFFEGEPSLNNVIWVSPTKILINPNDDFLDVLKLDNTGMPTNSNIVLGNVIKGINKADYFGGLFSTLVTSGIDESEVYLFSYDWRKDISDSTLDLKNEIDHVISDTGAENVNLISHSMGGLVVKNYLKNYSPKNINKIVSIGVPNSGAPSGFKILMYGDNLGVSYLSGLFGLNQDKIKEISQNMPSVYELLPSSKYLDSLDPDYSYYILDLVGKNDRLDYEETKSYLKDAGRNSTLVDRADAFHHQVDDLDPADYGVKTYNIIGCGTPTIGQFYILDKQGDHTTYNIKMINGDGTVPLKSAEAIPAVQTYFVKNAQHAVLPSTSGVKELVAMLVSTSTTPDVSTFSNLSTSESDCPKLNGQLVSFHSPIELHVYDNSGNHTGPDVNGDIENNIPGVDYETIEDNKFAFLPNGSDYTVKGVATHSGSFDLRIQTMVNDEVTKTTLFTDVPLGSATQTQFTVGNIVPDQIYLDENGDGVFETSHPASTSSPGLLLSTGKEPTVILTSQPSPSEVLSVLSGSPHREVYKEPISTSTSEFVKVAKLNPKKVIVSVNISGTSSSTSTNDINSAAVYKSYKDVFKRLWSWIKRKL